jgi:hypothetical protein
LITVWILVEHSRIGVTILPTLPGDAQDRETLLAIADRALFGSKGQGRDPIMLGRELTPVEES